MTRDEIVEAMARGMVDGYDPDETDLIDAGKALQALEGLGLVMPAEGHLNINMEGLIGYEGQGLNRPDQPKSSGEGS